MYPKKKLVKFALARSGRTNHSSRRNLTRASVSFQPCITSIGCCEIGTSLVFSRSQGGTTCTAAGTLGRAWLLVRGCTPSRPTRD